MNKTQIFKQATKCWSCVKTLNKDIEILQQMLNEVAEHKCHAALQLVMTNPSKKEDDPDVIDPNMPGFLKRLVELSGGIEKTIAYRDYHLSEPVMIRIIDLLLKDAKHHRQEHLDWLQEQEIDVEEMHRMDQEENEGNEE